VEIVIVYVGMLLVVLFFGKKEAGEVAV